MGWNSTSTTIFKENIGRVNYATKWQNNFAKKRQQKNNKLAIFRHWNFCKAIHNVKIIQNGKPMTRCWLEGSIIVNICIIFNKVLDAKPLIPYLSEYANSLTNKTTGE